MLIVLQCLAVDITWQSIGGGAVACGIIAGMFVYMRGQLRMQGDAALQKQADGWKNLYDIEHESNAQLVRNVKTLQESYDRLADDMRRIREDVKNKNRENEELVDLNIKLQKELREAKHNNASLQQALTSAKELAEMPEKETP